MLRPRRWTRFSQQHHNTANSNKLTQQQQQQQRQVASITAAEAAENKTNCNQATTTATTVCRSRCSRRCAASVAVAAAVAAALDVFVAAVTLQCAFARWTRRYTELKEVTDKRVRLSINARARARLFSPFDCDLWQLLALLVCCCCCCCYCCTRDYPRNINRDSMLNCHRVAFWQTPQRIIFIRIPIFISIWLSRWHRLRLCLRARFVAASASRLLFDFAFLLLIA